MTHSDWHDRVKNTWDSTNIDTGRLQTPAPDFGRGESSHIPFRQLALGIRAMPQQDDALDLTRMVQYCEQHPEEEWIYPRDYKRLLNHLGGPLPLLLAHSDRLTFERWTDSRPPPHRVWDERELQAVNNSEPESSGAARKRKQPARDSTLSSGFHSREKISKRKPQQHRRATSEDDTPLLDPLSLDHEEDDGGVGEHAHQDEEGYRRPLAGYFAPPAGTPVASTVSIMSAFAAEGGVAGGDDIHSPHAFGGPRQEPPYRMLHNIYQPESGDVSGWAENMRWALEQRAIFGRTPGSHEWNESPEHMNRIAGIRQQLVWASDELLLQLE